MMNVSVCGDYGDGRPPVPGQERETGQSSGKIPSHWVELSAATPRRPDLDLGFEPEGSASPHRPYQPWAETLHALLDDRDGTALFLRFLQPLGCSDLLEFWFACSGFQKVPEDTPGQRLKLAKAIYRCYLSEDGSTVVSRRVSSETRSCVWESIQQLHPTPSLFVQPQMEVEAVLEQSLFPVFLRSDIYFKLAQTSSQSPRKVPSPGSQERALPKYLPLQEKEAEPETIPPYNAANQKSRGNQVHSRRHHACHQHRRPTRERDTRHRHLPHTPMENVLMDSQTFTAELIRRLQELQRETQTHNLPAEEEDDASNVTSTCHSRKIEAGPAHSLCYYDTECTISQWHDTREETMKSIVIEQVKSVLSPDRRSTTSPHTHTHFTDMPDSTQTETWNYGSACESVTVVYFFCGELIPYRTSVKGTLVTLSQFKTLLIRTGRYRFYFKRASAEFDCGVVYEEISEDDAVLPIFEEKIIGKVERMME